jgi:hypothetical protein
MSKAFDVYLSILKTVESQLDKALGHNIPDWRLKNICPCCMHEVEGEEELAHSILTTIDGNNSLKLVDGSYRQGEMAEDLHIRSADFWLDEDFVNWFKDKVPSKVKGKGKGKAKVKETVVEVVVEGDHEQVPTQEDDEDEDEHWVDEEKDTTSQFKKVPHEVNNLVPGMKSGCVDRWKNAGPEGQKQMFSMFLLTGIFMCLCRHGLLLLLCNMVQSGEL